MSLMKFVVAFRLCPLHLAVAVRNHFGSIAQILAWLGTSSAGPFWFACLAGTDPGLKLGFVHVIFPLSDP